jgi:endonuclease-3
MEMKQKKALEIISKLKKAYPDAPVTYLNYSNPFEMLIATILSAQTADACVNGITPQLFERYPTPKRLMNAVQEDVVEIIRPCGKHNKKAHYICETARMIVEKYSGKVPDTMEELIPLLGVSRKTANVVLSVVFDKSEGVVVDTHVGRISQRLGLTSEKTPVKIERDLMELLPRSRWSEYAVLAGAHGRRTCKSRGPMCSVCSVRDLCPSAGMEGSK